MNLWQLHRRFQFSFFIFSAVVEVSKSFLISNSRATSRRIFGSMEKKATEESATVTPRWDPVEAIWVDGVVPENAAVQSMIAENDGYLRLFGYGSLCWNPGTGALAKTGVTSTIGKARGYKRCWAQKSTDHRGRPPFPGIVCTLLKDNEVTSMGSPEGDRTGTALGTMTEGVIFLIPPEEVDDCLTELDFREKGGYARDIIEVVEDETGEMHKALLYRGTPDNPAFWKRALLDLPFAAAIMAVSEGPSGRNDVYLNQLDQFLSDTHSIAAENDDTTSLAKMTRFFQTNSHLYFLFGSGSNQHNQLLLDRPNNAARLMNNGEDAHDKKEIILCVPARPNEDYDHPKQLFAGGGHSGLLTSSGRLYLWGWSADGQCGNCMSYSIDQEVEGAPMLIIHALSDISVQSAALGFNHTLVIEQETGLVFVFGNNERGQVSGGSQQLQTTPANRSHVPDFLKGIRAKAVAAGLFHSAVVTERGELITFGSGQFGQAIQTDESAGRWRPEDGSHVMAAACGRRHTIVADDKGRIWSFGENKYGQLGRPLGDRKFDACPTLVEGIPAISKDSTIQLECGWSHSIVHIRSKGDKEHQIYGWGRNDKGQLGLGTSSNVIVPAMLFESRQVESVFCGSECTMFVDHYGRIWGCGWNEHGNLATSDTEDQLIPVQSKGANVVAPEGLYEGKVSIAVGGAHFLAARMMG